MNRNAIITAIVGLAGTTLAAPTFNAPTSLATPQRPAGVAAADFDGDGNIDLAVATDALDKISVFTNSGGGAFAGPVNILTGAGTGPDDLVASDIDGDGDADLVVVLKNVNQVRIYLNTAGNFAAGASIATGAEPVDIAAGDINNDGQPDYVVTNRSGNSVTVLMNSGGALSASTVAVGAEPRTTAIADFDGDGDGDMAVTNHDSRTISILRNNGGAFAAVQTLTPPFNNRPDGIVAGDFDGDGDMDLAAPAGDDTLAQSVIAVWTNNAGTFGGPVNTPANATDPSDIAAADFDLDGDLDLVVINNDDGSMSTLEGFGNGTFAAAVIRPVGAAPDHVAIADLDGNNSPDVAITNRDSNTTSIFMNSMAGTNPCAPDLNNDGTLDFFDVQMFLASFAAQDAAADINNDGFWDFFDVQAYLASFAAGCP